MNKTMQLPSHMDRIKGRPPLDDDLPTELELADFEIEAAFEDTVLCEYADGTGTEKVIGGVIIQTNTENRLWRMVRVLMAGEKCKLVKENDIIMIPMTQGNIARVQNLRVRGKTYKELLFVKETIAFCKCSKIKK
jgi:hypothetical protein